MVIILIFVVSPVVPGKANSQSKCAAADEAYNEGNYEEALLAYTVLWDVYGEPCAKAGITKAEKALQDKAKRLYEIGKALDDSGHEELAVEAYISALSKDTKNIDSVEALEQKANSWLNRLSNISFQNILEFVVLLVALLIFVLKCAPWIASSLRCKPRLFIDRFDTGSTKLQLNKGLEMRIEDEFKKSMNVSDKALMKLVEGPITLRAPAGLGSTAHIKILSDLIEWAFPPNATILSGCLHESKKNGAGLTLKLKSNKTGEIIAADTLWQNEFDEDWKDREKDKEKRRQGDVKAGDPSDYYCLAKPAAIWILFKLIEYEEDRKLLRCGRDNQERKEKVRQSVLRLGTEDWKSYVFFQHGRDHDLINDVAEARKCYVKALESDPMNRYALCNLGLLTIEQGVREANDYKYEEAIGLLKRAKRLSIEYEKDLDWLEWMKEVMENNNCKCVHVDNMWFRAVLNLASAYHYGKNYNQATRVVSCILHSLEKTLEVSETVYEWEGGLLNRLRNCLTLALFIIAVKVKLPYVGRAYSVGLFGDCLRPKNDYLEDIRRLTDYLKELRHYTMVLHAISRVRADEIKDTDEHINKIISVIAESDDKKSDDKKEKREPPSQKKGESDEKKHKKKKRVRAKNVKAEIKYDLACYYSVAREEKKDVRKDEFEDEYDTAIKYLKDALLEGGITLEWAKVDPDLRGLRENREGEFNKLIHAYTVEITENQTSLSEVEKEKISAQIRRIRTEMLHKQHSSDEVHIIVLLCNENGVAVFRKETGKWELPEGPAKGNENLDLAVDRILSEYVLDSHQVKVDSSVLLYCTDCDKGVNRFYCVAIARMNEVEGKNFGKKEEIQVSFISRHDVTERKVEDTCQRCLLEKYLDSPNTLKTEAKSLGPSDTKRDRSENAGEPHEEDVRVPAPLIKVKGVLLAFCERNMGERKFRGIVLVRKRNSTSSGGGEWILPAAFVKRGETASKALSRHILDTYHITLQQDNILSALKIRTDPGRDSDFYVWTQPFACFFMEDHWNTWCETEEMRIFSLNRLPWDDMSLDCQHILRECMPRVLAFVEDSGVYSENKTRKPQRETQDK